MNISIITVVYNDAIGFKKTIDSLLLQKKKSNITIEYIVIDGGSKDGTYDLIEYYHSINVIDKYYSGPDCGIYDAMNKGIALARNEWLYFLNAGDCLASENVIIEIEKFLENNVELNFIYAPYISNDIINNTQDLNLNFLSSHMINHQSIFFKKTLFEKNQYDTSYKFCADYAHLLSVYKILKAKKTNFVVVKYDANGVSSNKKNKAEMWKERLLAILKSDFSFTEKIILCKRGIVAFPYHLLSKVVSFYDK